jgi:hypothetical protein
MAHAYRAGALKEYCREMPVDVQGFLRSRVRVVLAHRRQLGPVVRADLVRLSGGVRSTARELADLAAEVRRLVADTAHMTGPFVPTMTVEQAWRRHPLARTVFAQHHLPSCDQCAVRFDETVGEAADAYDLDLEQMMGALNALLVPG